ncbi:ribose transport system ATP-binding protein [Glaciihabitans tibetensis]|uniref:Ribose transport system ATP-binding protein n=1 Tax=Glaciihabitans tibetensis TaxID=1266600 RepID=A0A2T0VGS5_9MICO|nr:sugar ABC transporter ATP-binding protein [Glaciihabitans tibetensis]PRY69371.1 ribose transport system ATP-binding protein [Glaciihabitans tibetensis]
MITVDHKEPLLEVRGVTKSFAGVAALKGVDFSIVPGEVHCVLGQNGAGKSTLIKVLSGVYTPEAGELLWQGSGVSIADPTAALDLGIATMYQELDVVDGLTIAENIFLGHELSAGGVLKVREAHRRTRALLARLGHPDLSPSREVGSLSPANKQIVSMARALSRDIKLIVMDEPSAVLDSEEVKNLFRVVRELTRDGIAVVYISHRLAEIREIGDRITVIKDGRTTASGLLVSATPTAQLITLMTGRDVENVFPPAVPIPDAAAEMLRVENLSVRGLFEPVSFAVRAGEIFGLAGLVGSGRSEILEAIYGALRPSTGEVFVDGAPIRTGSVPTAVAKGIGLSPEERKSQGLILEQPVYRNVTLSSFPRFARSIFLNEKLERSMARTQLEALELRPADPDRAVGLLSGGNQQKVLLARWLVHGTKVLLLDEPTRGVDVGARAEIYSLIRQLSAAGTAIVVVSSEIEEVLGLADRVLVLADGETLDIRNAADIDESGVLDLVMKGSAE